MESPNQPRQHRSRALALVLSALERMRGPRVLDLGAANGRNVSFFSRYGARMAIADLRSVLRGDVSDPRDLARALELDLGSEEDPFNLVLAWDLFDYLAQNDRDRLGARIAAVTSKGARLFFFVSYRAQIPDCPRSYFLMDESVVAHDNNASAGNGSGHPSPRLREPQLLKSLPGFEVESTFLLQNGLQEYCLVKAR